MTTARQFFCAVFLLFVCSLSGFCQTNEEELRIIDQALDRVRLGMTLAQIRKAVHPLKLKKVQGLEGIPAVEIYFDFNPKFPYTALYFEDYYQPRGENEQYKIKESSKVVFIHDRYEYHVTRQGIHNGMLLSDAEKQFGKVDEIVIGTEGPYFAKFKALPHTYLELSGYFGYKKGQTTSSGFGEGATIQGIRLSPLSSDDHGTD